MSLDPNYTPPQEESQEEIETPGFMIYRDAVYMMKFMTAADTGRVMQAAFTYFLSGETTKAPLCLENPALEDMAQHIFGKIRKDIDRDAAKYLKTVERNRKNIRKRWGKQ